MARRFGRVRALRGVSFDVAAGETVAVFGGNGAGKSTLLRIVAGLVRPDRGTVRLSAEPAGVDPAQARRRIGYVSHASMLYESLSARENLIFAGRLHGVISVRTRIDQLLRSLELSGRADEPVRHLSRGLQQRVALARALLHDPELLLLDEPHTGLDQRAVGVLTGLLRAVGRRGRAVLLVTHDVALGLGLADRALVLHDGRIVLERRAAEAGPGFEAEYARCLAGELATAGAAP